jgi:site-specific recombinase XerD
MEKKEHEPVRLRKKMLADGGASLYLDKWCNGHRKYEFLKLYLVPEKCKADREKNRRTQRLAEAICARQVLEMRGRQYGFNTILPSEVLFYPYYEKQKKAAALAKKTSASWTCCLKHLRKYAPDEGLTFAQITPDWVNGFRSYLDTASDFRASCTDDKQLSEGSKFLYYSKFRAIIHRAMAEGILQQDPCVCVKGFRKSESTRMYLTPEEIRQLARTPCDNEGLKVAFLFSCFTGLRRSDVMGIKWGEVYDGGPLRRIVFKQQKTGQLEYLDISPQASRLMGERGRPEDHVFTMSCSQGVAGTILRQWVKTAGIDKDITFHCARHSFAVMMLELGTDIYTVSKLLGHKMVTTTQIYAKVMDKTKQAAVCAIPNLLG